MVYVKHPEHGNKHIPPEEVNSHVANGWVVWPRPASMKNFSVAAPIAIEPEPVKRGPGRPKKVSK